MATIIDFSGKYQVENNAFTRICNQILMDLMASDLSASELKIVLYVIRQTYGYQRADAAIKNAEISAATKIKPQTVYNVMKHLFERNIIIKKGGQRGKIKYNKYCSTWANNTPSNTTASLPGSVNSEKTSLPGSVNSVYRKTETQKSDSLYRSKESIEIEDPPPSVPPPKPESIALQKRGSRIAADAALTPEMETFCKEKNPDANPQELFNEFKDYWRAKPGANGVKIDWLATWRNWVRKDVKFNARKTDATHQQRYQSSYDRGHAIQEHNLRVLAEEFSEERLDGSAMDSV